MCASGSKIFLARYPWSAAGFYKFWGAFILCMSAKVETEERKRRGFILYASVAKMDTGGGNRRTVILCVSSSGRLGAPAVVVGRLALWWWVVCGCARVCVGCCCGCGGHVHTVSVPALVWLSWSCVLCVVRVCVCESGSESAPARAGVWGTLATHTLWDRSLK